MDLNTLDLMIAALYLRYRKREDHFISALWAKIVFGLMIVLLILTAVEVIIYFFELFTLRQFISIYYIALFAGLWIVSTFFIHKISIPFQSLKKAELAPDDYSRGNMLAFSLLAVSVCLYGIIVMKTR